MVKTKKYDPPTQTFPYKIRRRLNALSMPRRFSSDSYEFLPNITPNGVRKSALHAQISDRVNDASWPYMRRLLTIKRQYKNRFSPERIEKIDRMIEAANATIYTKLANCVIDLKKTDAKDVKKKRGWSESEWKKHMDYINQIAAPKAPKEPPPVSRGPRAPIEALLPRINNLCSLPEFKVYRRVSQEAWYKCPGKPSTSALKYVLSEHTRRLAIPKTATQTT